MTAKTPAQMKAEAATSFPDNTSGLITPAIMRSFQGDIIDSYSSGETINVLEYGAVGDGITDDTAAIQAAFDKAMLDGTGEIWFPAGVYIISSTIVVGNGSSSAQSTLNTIHIEGAGQIVPVPSNLVTYSTNGGVTLKAAASFTGDELFLIKGPTQGWSIKGFFFDNTASNVATGLKVITGQFGVCENVSFKDFQVAAIWMQSWDPASGTGQGNCQQNSFYNVTIRVPAVDNAKGIYLTGSSALPSTVTSNTCYQVFINTYISLAESAGANTMFAIYLGVCDSCTFINTHIVGGSNSLLGHIGVVFDYTVNNIYPSGHTFSRSSRYRAEILLPRSYQRLYSSSTCSTWVFQ